MKAHKITNVLLYFPISVKESLNYKCKGEVIKNLKNVMNMKKKISICCILICTLFLMGCQSAAVSDSEGEVQTAVQNGEEALLAEGQQAENSADSDGEEEGKQDGPYEVERVVDGDTLVINIDGVSEKVRLIGVDTPESVHPDSSKNVEYGKVASEYTKNTLENKSVTLELDVQERDKYGRLLAYIYSDGEMFNLKLIREGHAKVATFPPNVKYTEDFTAAQEEARKEGIGLWSYVEGTYVAEGYVGNKNTKKFHENSCSSVTAMKPENIVEFQSREEAVSGGYEPCGKCNP